MKRIIEAEKEYKGTFETAIKRFFKAYPELEYWKDQFNWMFNEGLDHCDDTLLNDGTRNHNWTYALHLDVNEGLIYIAIIERG